MTEICRGMVIELLLYLKYHRLKYSRGPVILLTIRLLDHLVTRILNVFKIID
jgi:hypothetical protein